jgi:hypothetical protein
MRVGRNLVILAAAGILIACEPPDRRAEQAAIPSTAHPLAGFWKKPDCTDRFGLAIAPARQLYSVSFCGPGGCFAPGTYRPDTPIAGDPQYRVLDINTIEVKGSDGFSKYVRCASR